MLKIEILVLIAIANPCFSNIEEDPWTDRAKPTPTPFQDWDYLVYSQRWPVTSCMEWEEKSPKDVCNLPTNLTEWNVHGVWPNKIGAEGPFYCDSALHFDPDQLEPIMDDLKERWTNIEGNTKMYSFWKHEWSKHGTCASSLPQLNSVYNYFKQGLDWNLGYKLAEMLAKNKIIPNENGYTIENIYSTVKSATGKNPIVECVIDGKSKKSLISEVRVCFNKNLELIDCNVSGYRAVRDGILSNCNLQEPVMYFANVPSYYDDNLDDVDELCVNRVIPQYPVDFLNLYKFIKFLIWFTL